MKLTTYLILLACLQVSAKGDAQKVSLHENRSSLEKVLKKIGHQTGYTFLYEDKVVEKASPVTLKVSNISLDAALNLCFKDQPLTYKIFERTVVIKENIFQYGALKKEEINAIPLANIVKGKVTNSRGEPLAGVSVIVKMNTTGTSTDGDGNYSVDVPANGTLVFSYVGFTTIEIPVNGRSSVNIILQESVSALDQVVVVGYGTVKKSDLTGSIVSVNAEDIQVGSANTLDKQLSGRVSGAQITQMNGQPGGSTTIRIRGTNSILGNNEPLYVIDGIPYGNSINADINPNDIQSIEILKDASSTAIYGSRGANGVVLITTKSGSSGSPKVDFDSYYSLSSITKKVDLLNAEEIAKIHKMAIENGVAQSYDPASIHGPGTDWQDELFRTSSSKNFQLSVSGGKEGLSYRFSGNYLDEKGIVLNSGYKRYALRTNINSKINDKLSFGINLYFSKSESNPGSDFKEVLTANPIYPVKDEFRNYIIYTDPLSQTGNPVATNLEYLRENNRNTMLSNVFGEYKIIKGLIARSNFGTNIFDIRNNSFAPRTIFQGISNNSVANIYNQNSFYWVITNTLTYDKTIDDNNSFQAMAGFTSEKTRAEDAGISANNYVTDYQLYHAIESAENQSATSSLFENQLASFISRLNYNLMNKYLITFSGRYDGSSKFGSENKWAFFPSGAFAWRISNEEFMSGITSTINDLKLRISAGTSGEQAIASYQTLPGLTTTAALFSGDQYRIGFIPNRLPSPGLKWEKTNQYDVGIDARLFNNRVVFTADYYYKKTTDLLYYKAIPTSTGYSGVLGNIGAIENKGMDFSIRTYNITGKFKWTSDFNISFNQNKILDLGEQPDGRKIKRILSPVGSVTNKQQLPDVNALIVGHPIGGAYGYVYEGTYKSVDEINNGYEPGKRPGDVRLKDLNGDQKINIDDRKVISNPNPSFFGGFNNSFEYANFDLNIFLQFVVGNELYNFDSWEGSTLDGIKNNFGWARDAWSRENSNSNIPRPGWSNRVNGVNTFYVEDASYLRVKNVTLGYTVPVKVGKFQALRLYCSADNLLTFTKYSGYNPDVSSGGNSSIISGFDEAQYPLARTILFGLNIKF